MLGYTIIVRKRETSFTTITIHVSDSIYYCVLYCLL